MVRKIVLEMWEQVNYCLNVSPKMTVLIYNMLQFVFLVKPCGVILH